MLSYDNVLGGIRIQRELVRNILIKIKKMVSEGNYRFLGNKSKNFQTLLKLGLKYTHVKQEILSLTPKEYSAGPLLDKNQTDFKDEYFWIFGKKISNSLIYIKLKMRETAIRKEILCMSFHIAEHQMRFPLK